MADGIPSPTEGELAFTITLDISAEHEVGNTPYGYRRLLDVSGGTIAGDRLQGSVMTGGLQYELELSNGVVEYQGINILDTGDGSRILVRNCGASGLIPWFEAAVDGEFDFLNTQAYLSSPPGRRRGGREHHLLRTPMTARLRRIRGTRPHKWCLASTGQAMLGSPGSSRASCLVQRTTSAPSLQPE